MSSNPYDNSFIAEALPAFISEAHEQIESLEHLLLHLEGAPGDRELLDALFRCAHTVKGSAGIFGLDRVVTFTHHVETLLDRLREGHLVLTPAISTLLLQANDQIRALVAAAQDPQAESAQDVQAREVIVQRLNVASGQAPTAAAALPLAGPGSDNVLGAPGAPTRLLRRRRCKTQRRPARPSPRAGTWPPASAPRPSATAWTR